MCLCIPAFAQWQWSSQGGSTAGDLGHDVAVDASGNVFITGYFSGTVSFGSISLNSAGGNDIFVAKYSSTGSPVWANRAGSTGSPELGRSVSLDGSGNVYVTGYFQSNASFGTTSMTSAGAEDIFVAKYNNGGTFQWAMKAGGTATDRGWGLVTDNSGNSYVTGSFQAVATVGSAPTLTSAGADDILLFKVTSAGAVAWKQRAGGTGSDVGKNIEKDAAAANLFITGNYNSTAAFGATSLTSLGMDDIYLAKYDAAGAFIWARSAGGTSWDFGLDVGVDGSGNSYITGYYQSNPATFGTYNLSNASGADIFTAKYDPSGNVLWAVQGGGASSDIGNAIAVDNAGNSFVAGYFGISAVFGATTLNASGGSYDILLITYDPAGNIICIDQAGGGSTDIANGITIDASSRSFVTGYFNTTAAFGSTSLTTSGGSDIFIAEWDCGAALPVELTTFTAKELNGREVLVQWTTASEANNDYFAIEKSADGKTFEETAKVKGAGNSSTEQHYSFTDTSPLSSPVEKGGTLFYRIRQVNFDGAYKFSPIVSASLSPSPGSSLLFYPNSRGEYLKIYGTCSCDEMKYIIYNSIGEQITAGKLSPEQDFLFEKEITTGKLPAGVYFILVDTGESRVVKKFCTW